MSIITGNVLARPRMDLTDAYHQMDGSGFIADSVFPPLAVETKIGQLEAILREAQTTIENLERSPDGSYNRVNQYIGKIDYDCEEIGGEHMVLDGDGKTISYNREMGAIALLSNLVNLKKESLFAAAAFTGWAGATANAATAWATAATATPIDDIVSAVNTVLLNSGVMPNALVLNPAVVQLILACEDTKERFPGAPMISQAMLQNSLAMLTGLEKIFVGRAIYNTVPEGRSFTGGYMIPSTDVLICHVPNAGPNDPAPAATGRTAIWTEDAGMGPLVVESYRDETRRGWAYRVRTNIDHVVMDAATGLKLAVTAAAT